MWLLDPDYDGRSLYPRQVFFPMAGANDGWARLARNLKAEIDEDLIEAYRGTASLPFEPGENRRIAVKIVDDRGIESLKVGGLEGEAPYAPGTRSIENILEEQVVQVPPEEWAKLPPDLIENLDQYTSEVAKQPETSAELPDTPAGRLFGLIRDLFSDVPQEEWDNRPDDLIENLDHYLYGTDKQ